ncbi:uncharacterized protein LOC144487638 [Mustelus asterias]
MCLCPSCSQCGVSELVPVCGMDGNELQGHTFHKLLLLLLLLSVVAAVSGDSPVPVSGFLAEQVVLPCTYNGNVPVSDLQSDFLHLDRTHLYQVLDSRIEQELDWESEFLLLFLLLLELGFTYSESDKDGIKTDTRSIKMKHLMMSL